MILELLEGFEGLEAGILIIEAHHEAHVHPILVQVIEETAAIGLAVQGPTDAVLDMAGLHAAGRHAPEFLEAETIGLGRAVLVQPELLDELLAHAAAAAFCEHGGARMDIRTRGEVGARAAVLLQSHVTAAHADDLTVLDERLSGAETREHVYP